MPYCFFRIKVAQPPSVVLKRLEEAVRPPFSLLRLLRTPDDIGEMLEGKHFVGVVGASRFRIRRDIAKPQRPGRKYQNSFLPVIHGRLTGSEQGTVVRLHMRLSVPVMVFILLFLGLVTHRTLHAWWVSQAPLTSALVPTFGVLTLVLVAFFPEAFIARRRLARALQTPLPAEIHPFPSHHPRTASRPCSHQ